MLFPNLWQGELCDAAVFLTDVAKRTLLCYAIDNIKKQSKRMHSVTNKNRTLHVYFCFSWELLSTSDREFRRSVFWVHISNNVLKSTPCCFNISGTVCEAAVYECQMFSYFSPVWLWKLMLLNWCTGSKGDAFGFGMWD